jgi:hypothetical protein
MLARSPFISPQIENVKGKKACPVTVEVRAKSNRDVFLAYQEGKGFLVFSTYELPEIAMGDILSHSRWDDRDGPWLTVRNVTKNKLVTVHVESGSLSLKSSCQLLGRLGVPSQITTIE